MRVVSISEHGEFCNCKSVADLQLQTESVQICSVFPAQRAIGKQFTDTGVTAYRGRPLITLPMVMYATVLRRRRRSATT